MTEPYAATEQQHPVAKPSGAWTADHEARRIPRILSGGQKAVHAAGKELLPILEGENEIVDYPVRLKRSDFTNYTGRAVRTAAGKPFAKPIKLGDDVPKSIQEWCEDVDQRGTNLHVFLHAAFEDAWWDGVSFILVDYPPPLGDKVSREDLKKAQRRPFALRYTADQLIGWRTVVINGREVLSQARLLECVTVDDGEYGEKEVRRIRVFRRQAVSVASDTNPPQTTAVILYELWEEREDPQTKKKNWVVAEAARPLLGMDEIPLIPIYVQQSAFFRGTPPFRELADKNITLYQLTSDLRHIEFVANIPVPVFSGVNEATFGKKVKWGPAGALLIPKDAKAAYLEHEGKCIGELKKSIGELKDECRWLSLEPLIPKGDLTAMGEALRAATAHSQLGLAAMLLEDAAEQMLRLMARWAGMEKDAKGVADSGGSVEIYKDFALSLEDPQIAQLLVEMAVSKGLTWKRCWLELMRRNVLGQDFDPKTEEKELLAEGMDDEDPEAKAAAEGKPAPPAPPAKQADA